jgi:hypothetical protein
MTFKEAGVTIVWGASIVACAQFTFEAYQATKGGWTGPGQGGLGNLPQDVGGAITGAGNKVEQTTLPTPPQSLIRPMATAVQARNARSAIRDWSKIMDWGTSNGWKVEDMYKWLTLQPWYHQFRGLSPQAATPPAPAKAGAEQVSGTVSGGIGQVVGGLVKNF